MVMEIDPLVDLVISSLNLSMLHRAINMVTPPEIHPLALQVHLTGSDSFRSACVFNGTAEAGYTRDKIPRNLKSRAMS